MTKVECGSERIKGMIASGGKKTVMLPSLGILSMGLFALW